MTQPQSDEREISTFCRVCEPACGLIAHVKDGRLIQLSPDKENPISRGFACNKGLAGDEIHRDPDRVDYPLRRRPDGESERISWDVAIEEIAAHVEYLYQHNRLAIANLDEFRREENPPIRYVIA